MRNRNPFTEEGRTRLRNFWRRLIGYFALAIILGALAGFGVFRFWTQAQLAPLQRLYLTQYFFGSVKASVSGRASSKYKLLTYQAPDSNGRTRAVGVTDAQARPTRDQNGRPIRNERGYVFEWNVGPGKELAWRQLTVNDRQMVAL